MSYYPLLKAPGCKGYTTVCNFSPNNWEVAKSRDRFVNLTWSSMDGWVTKNLGILPPDAMLTITADDVAQFAPAEALSLISLTDSVPPALADRLPKPDIGRTTVPAWRATLGLSSAASQTSYQGEMDPFPSQGTLLTFGPFMQFGANIENFLILLNIEEQPNYRYAELEICDAEGNGKGRFRVRNNEANIIPLDGLNLQPSDLPVIVCRQMAGIPLYFSRVADGTFLSLEHTHPPSSMVVLGRRWEAQKLLKNLWFKKVAA